MQPIDCAQPHDAEFAGFVTTNSDPVIDDDPDFELELIRRCAETGGENLVVVETDPGTCYAVPEEGFDVGADTDCGDADVV